MMCMWIYKFTYRYNCALKPRVKIFACKILRQLPLFHLGRLGEATRPWLHFEYWYLRQHKPIFMSSLVIRLLEIHSICILKWLLVYDCLMNILHLHQSIPYRGIVLHNHTVNHCQNHVFCWNAIRVQIPIKYVIGVKSAFEIGVLPSHSNNAQYVSQFYKKV